ncbi:MAG: HmuY family protein [bacterium]|jgi:hypothetical protein
MRSNLLFLLAVVMMLTGCFKKEDPIPANPVGPVEEVVIPMTEYYVNQVYFELSSGEQVSMNKKNDFDLSFACHDTSTLIRLNTATFMEAAETSQTDLSATVDTAGLSWSFDKSDGNPDSTALKNWIRITAGDTVYSDKVWVINRGISELGFPLGLMKVKFNRMTGDTYHFSYAPFGSNEVRESSVRKNPGYNYVQYGFTDGGEVRQIEPETNKWDLLFTQYTTLLFTDEGDPYPYLVTGTLVNEWGTDVAFDSTMIFNDIELDDVLFLEYSHNTDGIGYEWKELVGDPTGGDFYYQAKSNINYLIRSKEGIYYKLRFTGFYDQETGEKGFPTFEFQRL